MNDIVIGAVGAFVGGFFVWLAGQRSLRAAAVLEERRSWRATIRDLAVQALSFPTLAKADDLARRLAINLNPRDAEDRELVRQVSLLADDVGRRDEVTMRFALLLKHDWERAKLEGSWWPFYASRRAAHAGRAGDRVYDNKVPYPAVAAARSECDRIDGQPSDGPRRSS